MAHFFCKRQFFTSAGNSWRLLLLKNRRTFKFNLTVYYMLLLEEKRCTSNSINRLRLAENTHWLSTPLKTIFFMVLRKYYCNRTKIYSVLSIIIICIIENNCYNLMLFIINILFSFKTYRLNCAYQVTFDFFLF